MISFFRSFLTILAILVLCAPTAKAEIFVWQDPVSKVSLTVPDTWHMGTNQKPEDMVTFWAPGTNDYASCRMRVREDKRFVIYPQRYSDEIQRLYFSRTFWEDYAGEFDNAVINELRDNASLGRGFASFADISFITTAAGPKVAKRGIALVSLYNGHAYIIECSAEESAFDKWYKPFLSVAKSVDFRKSIHEFPAGNYRSFLRGQLAIHGAREEDTYYY